jgi:amino acid permease
VTLPTLKSTMAKPRHVVPMTVAAFFVVAGLFLSIMFLQYGVFGNLGPDNVIHGFRFSRPEGWWATNSPWETGSEGWVGQILAWSMTLHLLCSDAIYVPCTVVSFQAVLPGLFERSRAAWILLRIGIALFRLAVATYVSSFITLTSLVSSCFCVCNNILLPVISFYVAGPKERAGTGRRLAHALIFLFGSIMVVLGTYGAVKSLISEAAPSDDPGQVLRNGISGACKQAYIDATAKLSI